MEEIYQIEILQFNEWHEHSKTIYSRMEDAAHECLLIMPELRRHSAGVRIVKKEAGTPFQDVVYEKLWGGNVKKVDPDSAIRSNANEKTLDGKTSANVYLYSVIGLAATVVLGLSLIHI